MKEIETINCDDLDQFWECVSPIGKIFSSPGTKYIYRGQHDHTWKLIPKVCRTDFLKNYKRGMLSLLNDYPGQFLFEWHLLKQFTDYCDFIGLAIPNDSIEFRKYFDQNNITKTHGIETSKWPEDKVVELMALAQHHGVATRLLDFTRDPYIAAYFAASTAVLAVNEEFCQEERLSVYALDINKIQSYKGIRHILVPGSTSSNLSAQRGSFVLVENSGYRGKTFQSEFSSVESKIQSDTSILKCITLPRYLAGKLLDRCYSFGISAASVFPGYDGAAKAVFESVLAVNYHETMDPM